MSTALSVNLNKIALIRNSREGNFPCVVEHAKLCLEAGADGITVHPRPDQRHIRPGDVHQLAQLTRPLTGIEFNLEGNPFAPAMQAKAGSGASDDYPGFLALAKSSQPDQCTLVPDSNDQLTSDHGFDLRSSGERLRPIIDELQQQGMRVSLFMDPDLQQIELAKAIGADRIELYTGPYAEAHKRQSANFDELFNRYYRAAQHAADIGLGLNAGHDLNLDNLPQFRQIPQLLEVSIGHALTVDALHMGLATAVARYKAICHDEIDS